LRGLRFVFYFGFVVFHADGGFIDMGRSGVLVAKEQVDGLLI
jgi:hypothetical protein